MVSAGIAQLRPFYGGVLDADAAAKVEQRTHRFLAGRGRLFDERIADGRIVDGHADLITDDIFCLADGPRVLDCLEFDDRLRYVDVLDDAASWPWTSSTSTVPASVRWPRSERRTRWSAMAPQQQWAELRHRG